MIARLIADATVAALSATRIHWIARPQAEALPGIVLQVVSEDRPQHLDGFDDMRTARVQVDALAATAAESVDLIEAAIAALIGEAEMVDPEGADVTFWGADVEGPRDLGETTAQGFVYRATADLIIRYATQA